MSNKVFNNKDSTKNETATTATANNNLNLNSNTELIKRVNLDYQHCKLINYFLHNDVYSYKIIEAKPNYYDLTLEQRMQVLDAHHIDTLCKTIILENTEFNPEYANDDYQQYYLAIVQYTNEFSGEKIFRNLKRIHNDKHKENQISNKFYKFRLCKDEIAFDLSGYRFNCITPFLMKNENLKIIFPENLKAFDYFWIGGGEIELKVGISVNDFVKLYSNRIIIMDSSTN